MRLRLATHNACLILVITALALMPSGFAAEFAPGASKLIQWIRNNGGFVSPALAVFLIQGDQQSNVPEDGDGFGNDNERGVFVTQDVPANSTLLRLPMQLILGEDKAAVAAPDGLHPVDSLALFLVREMTNSNSHWQPYLDALPKEVPTSPLFLAQSALEGKLRQEQPELYEELMAFREAVSNRFAELHDIGWDDHDKLPLLNEDTLRWAVAVVLGRMFGVQHKRADGSWKKIYSLVPLCDLFNTNFPPSTLNADCRTDPDAGEFMCFTTKSVNSNEQIFLPYVGADNPERPVDNLHLLVNYGFVTMPQPGQKSFDEEASMYRSVKPLLDAAALEAKLAMRNAKDEL